MERDSIERENRSTADPAESGRKPVQEVRIMAAQSESVPSDVYEELLGRYERALIFAGQLQEKGRQSRLLEEKSQKLEQLAENLRKQVAVDEGYIRMLENALKALGILR